MEAVKAIGIARMALPSDRSIYVNREKQAYKCIALASDPNDADAKWHRNGTGTQTFLLATTINQGLKRLFERGESTVMPVHLVARKAYQGHVWQDHSRRQGACAASQ